MRQRALAGPVIARLAEHPGRFFANRAAWTAHLDRLGISALTVNPDPATVATEGALWGSIKGHGFLPDTVIVSDDAGQFNVGQHGLCWVHAKRLVHKLDTSTDEHRIAQRRIRSLIWRDCRDAFLGLAKTCAKLKIAFWDYLGSRLQAPNHHDIPSPPQLIRHRCATA